MATVIDTADLIKQINQETKISPKQIQAVLNLLSEGNTIPFIARYRKEVTGSLDEVQIHDIEQKYTYAKQLGERKEEVVRLIAEQEKLTDEIEQSIMKSSTLQQVEDIYRPFKQSRRTKAMTAKENGLEPLAEWLLSVEATDATPEAEAEKYLNDEVPSAQDALVGAHEILAQEVSDNAQFREFIRKYTRYNAKIATTLKDEDKDENKVYQQYYEFSEPLNTLMSHRTLAINRAEKEGVITVKIQVDAEPVIKYMSNRFIPKELNEDKKELVQLAVEDAYKRFIGPAIEREMRSEATEEASQQAIKVFGENLRNLLLQPPLKGRVVMGFDPAYRTGCKLAIINETGRVLDKGVIYPHKPAAAPKRQAAKGELLEFIRKHDVDIIAIGNGTASRESEQFVSDLIKEHNLDTQFIVINEAGASVYSASAIARKEFPDFQVEERSAVSIARRLQDPIAELIKIDPKSMGVGQYQHDVSQKDLTQQLDFVVNITVNQVGVDLNTASIQLLEHVSGLTAATAKNVIALRDEIGHFSSREQIKDVKRLGPKTYEQAVGFMRILGGENPLDQTSIHPESYKVALDILDQANVNVNDIGSEEAIETLKSLKASDLATQYDLGEETISDILDGLMHPTADVRDGQNAPVLRADVLSMEDLDEGMQLQGVVRNVVDFGAFVDIGVKQDGLVHISKLSKNFIKHPSDAVSVGDIIEVEVISLDRQKGRIGLKRIFNKK
ncbi:RNA-binding transcriptional accessory protein [Aerococcaceae bacterium INB8]|uniref:RNA-binding transcriptional accessory protein n=1 Tax=Ruoffia halotolerans TaxID=2748684 RepID=A0A839A3I8_9LACT|nr:Tex family protein [Ruoffia halotolerans]MBA5728567.1 RNA-binding transcriptional accessory protein [Ruoffia halotolerans]